MEARPSPVRRSRAGFSLVELLLVLTLIGVMAGSVAVALQGRAAPHALRASADDLATALRYARQEAVGTRHNHRVVFTEDMRSYRVEVMRPDDDAGWVPAAGMAGNDHRLSPDVTLTLLGEGNAPAAGGDAVVLSCEFGPVDGFSGGLQLRNAALDQAVVEVLPRTGQVRITEGGNHP